MPIAKAASTALPLQSPWAGDGVDELDERREALAGPWRWKRHPLRCRWDGFARLAHLQIEEDLSVL